MNTVTITTTKPHVNHLVIYLRSFKNDTTTTITNPGDHLRPAGLRNDDVLLSVNGTNVDGSVQGCQLLSAVEAGKVMELVVRRKLDKELQGKEEPKTTKEERKPIGHAKPQSFTSVMAAPPDSAAPAESGFFSGLGEWVGMVSKRILREEEPAETTSKLDGSPRP